MSKAERIVEELQKMVKNSYGELLFDEGKDYHLEEGLIGGIKDKVIKMIDDIINE